MTIILEKDLPSSFVSLSKLSHKIAEICFLQSWNIAVEEINKLKSQISGNEALSYFGTLVSDFTARWIFEMIKIANKDDAGIEADELVKSTFNAIATMLGRRIEYKDKEKELPDGIKRLNK